MSNRTKTKDNGSGNSTVSRHNGKKHDVVIVGSGPAGAASALFLLKAGIQPVILEKEIFPRYHIGESLTGECGMCLRQLGLESEMLKAKYPVKYGVKVYGPAGKDAFWVPVAKRNENNELEAASTWQVRRSTFDDMMLQTAADRGAEIVQGQAVAPLMEDDRVTGVRFRTPGGSESKLQSKILIDASGQSLFLANKKVTSKIERGDYDKQVAIFSQVVDAVRDPEDACGNTLIFYGEPNWPDPKEWTV